MRFFLFFSAAMIVDATMGQDVGSIYQEAALTKLQNARAYTLEVADLMPAEHYAFQPTIEQMSFAEQLLHLSSNLQRLSAKLNNSTPPVAIDPKVTDKTTVRAVVEQTYDYAIAVMTAFDTRQLSDTVDFFAGPMTKLQIANLINDHQTHHRGQLLIYLRLQGVEPPRYIGW